MGEAIYPVYVCRKIEKLLENKKILPIEHSGYIFKDLKKENVYKVYQASSLGLACKINLKEYEFISYAYSESNVTQASLKEKVTVKKVTRNPINMKDVKAWLKEDGSQIETVEEEQMPKVISDTGAKPIIQFPGKFLSIEECKELFKLNRSSKTKYSWYLDLNTKEEIVALDFYKNTDYSQADIDWLYTQYKHLYFAFEKNGNEEQPLFNEARLIENKNKVDKPKNTKSNTPVKVAQSSKKIGSGVILEREGVLPIEICRRLWIIFSDSEKDDSTLSWWSKDKKVFCDDSKLKDATFVSKVYLKKDFEGIDYGLNVNQLSEPEVKHLVNSYIYEQSRS